MSKDRHHSKGAALSGVAARQAVNNRTRCINFATSTAAAQRAVLLAILILRSISTLDARRLGVMHPAARIMELRKAGNEIITHWSLEYCAAGKPHRIARYVLTRLAPVSTEVQS